MLVGASWVGRKIRETSGVTDIHIYGGLSARNYDVAGLKSSSIPPVRSLEAWGVRGKSLRTCRKIPQHFGLHVPIPSLRPFLGIDDIGGRRGCTVSPWGVACGEYMYITHIQNTQTRTAGFWTSVYASVSGFRRFVITCS